jgi:hypothetical protein
LIILLLLYPLYFAVNQENKGKKAEEAPNIADLVDKKVANLAKPEHIIQEVTFFAHDEEGKICF